MAIYTADIAAKVNVMNPTAQHGTIGDTIREVQQRTGMDESSTSFSPLILFTYAVVADASTATLMGVIPFAAEILDIFVQCRVASGSGTATVRNGSTNPITNAMIMAVDKTMVRAGTIDKTYSVLTAGTSLYVICNGSADRGLVTVLMKKT